MFGPPAVQASPAAPLRASGRTGSEAPRQGEMQGNAVPAPPAQPWRRAEAIGRAGKRACGDRVSSATWTCSLAKPSVTWAGAIWRACYREGGCRTIITPSSPATVKAGDCPYGDIPRTTPPCLRIRYIVWPQLGGPDRSREGFSEGAASGVRALRLAIARKLRKDWTPPAVPAEILGTPGAPQKGSVGSPSPSFPDGRGGVAKTWSHGQPDEVKLYHRPR